MSSRESRKQRNLGFSDYVLTFETGPEIGLMPANTAKMLIWSGSIASGTNPAAEININSTPYQFDFSFPFNGKQYNKIVIGEQGFCILVDRTVTGTFNAGDVFETGPSSRQVLDTFTNDHVLINPWTSYIQAPIAGQNGGDYENGQYDPTAYLANRQYWNEKTGGIRFMAQAYAPDGSRYAIVRWSTLNAYFRLANFEALFYENGKMEFRFENTADIRVPPTDFERSAAAELGIADHPASVIFCASASVSFRDFSTELSTDNTRPVYKYGGYVSSSSEIFALSAAENWPGGTIGGGLFTFQPLPNKKRVLPRGAPRGTSLRIKTKTLDDRKTIIFNSGSVKSYPTQLTRFYQTNAPGVTQLQNNYTNDIEVTGSTPISVLQGTIPLQYPCYCSPFDDASDKTLLNDDFFSSGSIDGFQVNARSQTQVKISFSVDRKTMMFSTSSAMYYYNVGRKSWIMPQNSLTVDLGASSPNFPPPFSAQDINKNLSSTIARDVVPEDARGFTALGLINASGSQTLGIRTPSSDMRGANITLRSDAVSTKFEKSVLNNPDYFPRNDEVFSLPIEAPFLLEKAVIEIPIDFGDNWFKDITAPMVPFDHTGSFKFNSLTSSLFDIGGPALTVALFNRVGNDQNNPKIDLILSSTITHTYDNTRNVQIFTNPLSAGGVLRHVGFKSFGVTPGAVVVPNMSSSANGHSFTGSVKIQAQASVGHGVVLGLHGDALSNANLASSSPYFAIYELITAPKLALQNRSYLFPFNQKMIIDTHLNQIKPYGRSLTGFLPSGRSIFGGEHIAQAGIENNNVVDNPLFVDVGSNIVNYDIYSYILDMIGHNYVTNETISMAFAAIPLLSSTPSPYLLLPGDALTLAVSKTRPVIYQKSGSTAIFSGTTGHDVMLSTGSVNITLYGSYVKNNQAFNERINVKHNQTAIYDTVIGNEPVLDQFEPSYNAQYVNTFSDAVVTGSLYLRTSKNQLTESQRGRVFSSVLANSQPIASSSGFIPGYSIPLTRSYANSLSDFTTFQYENFAKTQISTQLISDERFYDSSVPDISSMWKIDGAKIGRIDLASSSVAALFISNRNSAILSTSIEPLNNAAFARSFPFEPRYAFVSRQLDQQIFNADYVVATGQTTSPTFLKSTVIVFGSSADDATGTPFYDDLRIFGGSVIDSETADTINFQNNLKFLFGFGNFNTMTSSIVSGSALYNGSNNLVETKVFFPYTLSQNSYAVGPIVRGWKRGLISGYAHYTKMYYRRGKFGQFRDMLEQRQDSKFYQRRGPFFSNKSLGGGVVTTRAVDDTGLAIDPMDTSLSNISYELTSSLPYFDGISVNR